MLHNDVIFIIDSISYVVIFLMSRMTTRFFPTQMQVKEFFSQKRTGLVFFYYLSREPPENQMVIKADARCVSPVACGHYILITDHYVI